MRIGISILITKDINVWSNGLLINLFCFYDLLKEINFVSSVVLIDIGKNCPLPDKLMYFYPDITILDTHQAAEEVDVIIEFGGALDAGWLDLMRLRGKKVVYLCCGQPYATLIDGGLFNREAALLRFDRVDEVWLLPKDKQFIPMLRTLCRCPVYEVPYIWDSKFLEHRIREISDILKTQFGYVPHATPDEAEFCVGIFEPNLSAIKSCVLPMLICENAYSQNPASVSFMHVFCSIHMKDHPNLLYFANSLDLVRHHKACFHGRHDFAGIVMDKRINAVVSHQWLNDQNYLYLDALFGGYPLIHNSPWIKDYGYYYEGFDAKQGGDALLRAIAEHDRNLDDYRKRAKLLINSLSPKHSMNLQGYAERLQILCGTIH